MAEIATIARPYAEALFKAGGGAAEAEQLNALAAVAAGVDRLDGSVGALGGCPFAPGASGNVALEDLDHVLVAEGVSTGVDVEGLVVAAEVACAAVGREVGSHVGRAGPRFPDPRP